MNFTLYAIYSLAGTGADKEAFTKDLPFDVTESVRIENVSGLLEQGAFDSVKARMGTDFVDTLKGVRHALVHRYNPEPIIDPATNRVISVAQQDEDSRRLIREVAACLRLIRPTRQSVEQMWGRILKNGRLDVMGFTHPVDLMETPQNQKLFTIRNEDADALRACVPGFLGAMKNVWKFKMATQFHELGHWLQWNLKGRYSLWASAIEAIYTSNDPEHRGSQVAKARIKWFLKESTSIYPAGELSDLVTKPDRTIGNVLEDLYLVRNHVAHGDRIPDRIFQETWRDGVNGPVDVFNGLFEAQSFIIRASLLKILRENLFGHFSDAASSETYFGKEKLTRTALSPQKRGAAKP